MERDDLTKKQNDYAIFLPALSGFYASYIGKQRENGEHVPASRMPATIPDMEQLNWLNPGKGLFTYRWSLYSAGHANLDITKADSAEYMVRNRDPDALIVGDSGGFQIAKGVWEGIWAAPTSVKVKNTLARLSGKTETRITKSGKTVTVDLSKEYQDKLDQAQKKRDGVLRWMDEYMNYGMILDTPAWVANTPVGPRIGITKYQDAVEATQYNNEYWITNRKGVEAGGAKLLNVLQGSNHDEALGWYNTMKQYCDPVQYPGKHFDGWAMGGQTKTDAHLMLLLLNEIRWDGLMQQGVQDWLHVLGTSKIEYALLLTNIQRALRKYVNPDFTISFDCASPFLATANGQIYHHANVTGNRWMYRMSKSIDDKKYATDSRSLRDVAMTDFQDHFKHFDESPISARLKISDICIYKPGFPKPGVTITDENFKDESLYDVVPDLNKIGKIGRTSWDSFSYALQMSHNVWTHIYAVQEANRQYDAGELPKSMQWSAGDYAKCRDIVDRIFSASSKQQAEQIINQYSKYWMEIVGSFGNIGKRAMNSETMFLQLFTQVDQPQDDGDGAVGDDMEFDESSIENLESEQEN